MRDEHNKSDPTNDRMVTLFMLGGTVILNTFVWAFFILHAIG